MAEDSERSRPLCVTIAYSRVSLICGERGGRYLAPGTPSIGTNLLFFEKGEATKEIWFYEHRVPEGQKAHSMTKPIRIEHLKLCVDLWGDTKRKSHKETEVAWWVTADEIKAGGNNLDFKNPHTITEDHGDPEELLAKHDEAEKQTVALRDQPRAILEEELLR